MLFGQWVGIFASSWHSLKMYLSQTRLLMSQPGVHILGEAYCWSGGVSDSAPRQKNWTKQFFPLPLYRVYDLCNSPGLANREVSALNQLYSKGRVPVFLNSVIPKPRTILLQVEYTGRANILKVSVHALYFSTARTIFLVETEAKNSFLLQNSKLHGKKYSKNHFFLKRGYYTISIYGTINYRGWQTRLTFLSTRLAVYLWDGQIPIAQGSEQLKQVTIYCKQYSMTSFSYSISSSSRVEDLVI